MQDKLYLPQSSSYWKVKRMKHSDVPQNSLETDYHIMQAVGGMRDEFKLEAGSMGFKCYQSNLWNIHCFKEIATIKLTVPQ